jgi:hypothetical protein
MKTTDTGNPQLAQKAQRDTIVLLLIGTFGWGRGEWWERDDCEWEGWVDDSVILPVCSASCCEEVETGRLGRDGEMVCWLWLGLGLDYHLTPLAPCCQLSSQYGNNRHGQPTTGNKTLSWTTLYFFVIGMFGWDRWGGVGRRRL